LDVKVSAVEATVPAQKRIGLRCRVCADEEVGHQTITRAARATTALAPKATRSSGGFFADCFESDAEESEGSLEGFVAVEVSAHLSPDNVTGHQCSRVVCSAQSFSRGRAEPWVTTKDIEKDG
jgi:hypothetical protein